MYFTYTYNREGEEFQQHNQHNHDTSTGHIETPHHPPARSRHDLAHLGMRNHEKHGAGCRNWSSRRRRTGRHYREQNRQLGYRGAAIGAVVGGGAGALIGNYMDKQAEEIDNQVEGARVERVGESIRIVFDSGILFSTGSSTMTSTSRYNIEKLARILNRYSSTNLVIEGHTDSVGSETLNQTLSERRAESVANLLAGYGVARYRLSPVGFGETRPVATNETEYGKRLNRRVEVLISANDELKDQAASGELKM